MAERENTILRSRLSKRCLFIQSSFKVNSIYKETQNQLEISKMKILRGIIGGKKMEEGWERKTNQELYNMSNKLTIN